MKNLFIIPVIFLMLLAQNTDSVQEAEKESVESKTDLETKGGSLIISGQAISHSSQEYQLRYELSVITGNKDNSNTSQNNQSGSFVLPASGAITLSRTSISKNPGSQAIIKLHLLQKDKIVARDSLSLQF